MEKPFAHSLEAIDRIGEMAKAKRIRIVSGFYLKYTGIIENIEKIGKKFLDSDPSMLVVHGGAKCLVTNGIHFLDLACKLFNSQPISVSSKMYSDKINPRSKDLGFWEGTIHYEFNDKRYFSISFTNMSSVNQDCTIYFKNGTIKFDEYGNIKIYQRDRKELALDNRIVRTGNVFHKNNSIDFKPVEYENVIINSYSRLENMNNIPNFDDEVLSTRILISALISNQNNTSLSLPVDKKNKLYNKEWPIS